MRALETLTQLVSVATGVRAAVQNLDIDRGASLSQLQIRESKVGDEPYARKSIHAHAMDIKLNYFSIRPSAQRLKQS